MDKRMNQNDVIRQIIPSTVKQEDLKSYSQGITILNEIATDTLAVEIMENMSVKYKWFAPFSLLSRKANPTALAYNSTIDTIAKVFGGKEKFELFRKELVLSMYTKDHTQLNETVQGFGFKNIDDFAIQLGNGNKFDEIGEAIAKGIGNADMFERLRGMLGSTVNPNFPGVISYASANIVLPPINAYIAMGSMAQIIQTLPVYKEQPILLGTTVLASLLNMGLLLGTSSMGSQSLIHETCHYLSQGMSHIGLIPLEMVPKSTQTNQLS